MPVLSVQLGRRSMSELAADITELNTDSLDTVDKIEALKDLKCFEQPDLVGTCHKRLQSLSLVI